MLVPQGVANLLVAGRCASMTHEGQSAARASGGCFVMGQAAGTAAAMLQAGQTFTDTDVKHCNSCSRETACISITISPTTLFNGDL
jgi:hypothetical protein